MSNLKIFTSNYSIAARHLLGQKYQCYQISNTKPSFFPEIPRLELLIPDWDWVSDLKMGLITEAEFVRLYTEERLVNLPEVKQQLVRDFVKTGFKPVLLCWEGKGKFCHRHLLSDADPESISEWIR